MTQARRHQVPEPSIERTAPGRFRVLRIWVLILGVVAAPFAYGQRPSGRENCEERLAHFRLLIALTGLTIAAAHAQDAVAPSQFSIKQERSATRRAGSLSNQPFIIMQTIHAAILALVLSVAGCAGAPSVPAMSDARQQVFAAERAFARTMADRDLKGFASFVSDEAIFYSGPTPLRGKASVIDAWTKFYAGPKAPFSWEPKEVEVLDSGTLAISSGPVRDESGTVVATFTSIWRKESSNDWRVIFDKGSKACNCAAPTP